MKEPKQRREHANEWKQHAELMKEQKKHREHTNKWKQHAELIKEPKKKDDLKHMNETLQNMSTTNIQLFKTRKSTEMICQCSQSILLQIS